jgi:hypothetical protein
LIPDPRPGSTTADAAPGPLADGLAFRQVLPALEGESNAFVLSATINTAVYEGYRRGVDGDLHPDQQQERSLRESADVCVAVSLAHGPAATTTGTTVVDLGNYQEDRRTSDAFWSAYWDASGVELGGMGS